MHRAHGPVVVVPARISWRLSSSLLLRLRRPVVGGSFAQFASHRGSGRAVSTTHHHHHPNTAASSRNSSSTNTASQSSPSHLPLSTTQISPMALDQATTTTFSTSTAMAVQDELCPDVELVWRRVEDGTITVSLLPRKQSSSESKAPCSDSSSSPSTTTSSNTPLTQEAEGNNSNDGDESTVPEAVLTYERQLRKHQHAKKLGRALHPQDDLDVVYVDESIVVVNKPPGVLTVPGVHNNQSCLLNLVHAQYASNNNDDIPAPATLIVHRLDMDTSGLIVFARTPAVASTLHATFRDRRVIKEYECLVVGHVPTGYDDDGSNDNNSDDATTTTTTTRSILIDLPLQKDHQHPPFMRVATPRSRHAAQEAVHQLQRHGWKKLVAKPAKASQTSLRVVERGQAAADDDESSTQPPLLPYTRLRLVPLTGRTHQLRVHCAALGHPIVGDPTYGLYGEAAPVGGLEDISMSQVLSRETTQLLPRGTSLSIQKAWTAHYPPNQKPMCLHAALLGFPHPVTGELMKWEVPPNF